MKPDKERNYAASYSDRATLGGIKAQDRDREEQIESESETEGEHRDKVLTAGLFVSLRQDGVKEAKCEQMDRAH